jgi:hypothetical protein
MSDPPQPPAAALEPGPGPLRPRGVGWGVRTFVVLLLAAQPFVWAGLTLFELAGSRFGFWWALLVELLLVLLASLFMARSARTGAVLGVACLLAVAAALSIAAGATPAQDRVALAADRLPVPDDWRVVGEESYGNSLCFDTCSSLSRTYVTPDHASQADELERALAEEGWRALDFGWERGDFEVDVRSADEMELGPELTKYPVAYQVVVNVRAKG